MVFLRACAAKTNFRPEHAGASFHNSFPALARATNDRGISPPSNDMPNLENVKDLWPAIVMSYVHNGEFVLRVTITLTVLVIANQRLPMPLPNDINRFVEGVDSESRNLRGTRRRNFD